MSHDKFKFCIDACHAASVACDHCATSCLQEDEIEMMTLCIELDRQCALVCAATAQLMSIGGEYAALLCSACADMCDACAAECEKHDAEHCQRCAELCRACATECRKMAGQFVL